MKYNVECIEYYDHAAQDRIASIEVGAHTCYIIRTIGANVYESDDKVLLLSDEMLCLQRGRVRVENITVNEVRKTDIITRKKIGTIDLEVDY